MQTLFTPVSIGALTLKNRFMMSPMENGMAHVGGMVSDRLTEFFAERARRGVALIMTGSVAVSPEGAGLPAQIGIYDDRFVPGLTSLCARIHAEGGRIGAQLYHAGRQATEATTGLCPVAPSALPCPLLGNHPRALEASELPDLVRKFGDGARRAVKAGFDLLEVHFAHGYLLASFLSPHSNRRTDEYGGSLENRCRFPLAVLREVIRAAEGRVPVTIRISVSEFLEDGLTFEEVKKICLLAQEAGAQAVSVTAGCYESIHTSIQPMFVPQGFLIPYAATLKKLLSVPVIVAGRLNDAALLERCVAEGLADMVAVGRGLIADPGLVEKIRDGRPEDIRYCVACNQGCCDALFRGESVGCMLNARASFERERRILPAEVKKNVAIVGAGPAGVETARVAAMRGHNVTLFERGETGGKRSLIAAPPEKDSFLLFSSYLKTQLDKAGVRIIRREVRSPEDIAEVSPDHVVIATGAQQTIPPIPGADLPCVMPAEDVLAGRRFPGASAVIIGGGLVGVETAHFLAAKGVKVTILEKLDAVAREAGATCVEHIHDMLKKYAVDVRTGVNIECITKEGVRTSEAFHAAEAVVIAAGYAPRTGLADAMRRAFGQVSVIGDARGSANVLQAVHDGFLCASQL